MLADVRVVLISMLTMCLAGVRGMLVVLSALLMSVGLMGLALLSVCTARSLNVVVLEYVVWSMVVPRQ